MPPAETSASVSFFGDGVAADSVYNATREAEDEYTRQAKELVEFLWQAAAVAFVTWLQC